MKLSIRHSIALILLALPICGGCASLRSRLSASPEARAAWLEDMRAVSGQGSYLGVSEESRAIESSLGVK